MRGTELTLDEMLADPMVRLVMRRDGVEETDLRALLRRVRDRLRNAGHRRPDPSDIPRPTESWDL